MARKELNEELVGKIYEKLSGEVELVDESKGGVFNENLPSSQTPESVKELVDYTSEFAAASVAAVGRAAEERLVKNTDAASVSGDVSMGYMGSVGVVVHRTHEVTSPSPTKGEPPVRTPTPGYTTSKVVFNGGKNSAMMKRAKDSVKESVAAALNK